MQYSEQLAYQPLHEQEQYQAQALKQTLHYLADHSPFYRQLFDRQHIDVSNIETLADLRFLPQTTKTDLQQHNWDFLCVSDRQIREYAVTSGTLGRPVVIALTQNDLERIAGNQRRALTCTGAHDGDIFQLMLTLDYQFMGGMACYLGLRELGASIIRSGQGMPEFQLETIRQLQPNSIITVPSLLISVINYARENGIELKDLPVIKAICVAENIRTSDFELNTAGHTIAEHWPIKLFSAYSSTEMQTTFTECSYCQGVHHQPDMLIMEVLNDHGDQMQEGEYGELTITTLGVEGMPLLRYRTGDIVAYYNAPCKCGRHSRRLSPVLGRKQQMIKYKGTTLYPPVIFETLDKLTFINDYVVEVFTGELETDELRIHIHTELPETDCSLRLEQALFPQLKVVPQFSFHESKVLRTLQAATETGSRLLDKRDMM